MNQSKNIINSIKLDFIDEQNKKNNLDFRNGTQNTNIYIPRLDGRYSEENIKFITAHLSKWNIGIWHTLKDI